MHLAGNPAHPLQPFRGCPWLESSAPEAGFTISFHRSNVAAQSCAGAARQTGWADAIQAVASVFRRYRSAEIAFVLGLFPDHLNDLVQMLAAALGGRTCCVSTRWESSKVGSR